jgi:hypothetical protein
MAIIIEQKEIVFLTASGKKQKVNKAAVAKSDYSVFQNFTRYNKATQTALVLGIGKVGETGITIDRDNTGGTWVHIGNGKYIFIPAPNPEIPPLPPNPYIQAEIQKAVSGNYVFKRTFSNATCCDINIIKDDKIVLNMIVIDAK